LLEQTENENTRQKEEEEGPQRAISIHKRGRVTAASAKD
jgi:hypothetical protein